MLIKDSVNLTKAVKSIGIKGRIIEGEDLKKHTTLKIGGEAKYFIVPFDGEDIAKIINFANDNQVPYVILGGGSKILFPDLIFKGIVINLNNHFFKKIILDKEYVKIDAGVKINELLGWMLRNRLGDWEFLAGIPGTLGGAVRLNAGVRDLTEANNYLQIGDFVKEVTVLDKNGKLLRLDKKDLKFDYRESNLSNFVILQVILTKGEKKDISHIKKRINNFLNYRKKTQDLKSPSAGCVFKNPGNNKSSGELIELSGLKGKRIGDVAVSKKHANFFINLGKATAKDFLTLMEYVQRKVNYDHGVWLNPEIHIIRNL